MKFLQIVTFFAATAWAGDPWPTRIPDRLSICYMNKTLSDRYYRLPASLDNLVAIIRKVEAHPDTALWSMGKMASTLIHRFRYDGIVDVLDAGPDVVPVENERVESDKFRLQWRLVSGTGSDFPESSLTQEEKCSLHWMLSYTVNHTVRAEDIKRSTAFRSLDIKPNYSEEKTSDERQFESTENNEDPNKQINEEHNEEHNEDHNEDQEQKKPTDEDTVQTDVEVDDKGEEQTNEEVEVESSPEVSTDEENSEDFLRRKRQTNPVSTQPLEGGVIHTKYGAVAAGPVLMGIAAGCEPQSAKLEELVRNRTAQLSEETLKRVVESIWVATLAGDIAQTSLLRTSKRLENFGPRGQWNYTFCPREYKLNMAEHSMLTNAEFYGGLDGLVLATRMSSRDVNDYLKLSSILEMYYSESGIHGDSKYRACNRINNYRDPSIVDPNLLKDQILNVALIMYSRGINGAPTIAPGEKPADRINQYVITTMTKIDQFIANSTGPDKDFQQCRGAYSELTTDPTPATYTDLTFVFDQSTDSASIQSQKNLAAALALAMDIQVGGSRMETVSGKDGNPYFDLSFTRNRAELACKTASLPLGYNERRVSDSLDKTRERILLERSTENTYLVAGANTRSILFFVTSSISSEKDKIKSVVLKISSEMPDVHIMFATMSNPEELRPFVADFDRDIIKMNLYTIYSEAAPEIAKRLAKVGARLSYPECKDISSKGNTTEPKYVYSNFLNLRTVQYYRLGVENFNSSDDLSLRFQTFYGVARYCVSTTKERPGTSDNCKTAAKAGDTIEFKFSQPCESQCSNIYISATPINLDDGIPCSEKACHTPDQVKFSFSHSGMRCSAAIGAILSPLTLAVAALMTLFLNR